MSGRGGGKLGLIHGGDRCRPRCGPLMSVCDLWRGSAQVITLSVHVRRKEC